MAVGYSLHYVVTSISDNLKNEKNQRQFRDSSIKMKFIKGGDLLKLCQAKEFYLI